MPPQAFVLRPGPARQTLIQVAERRVQCRLVVPTVVGDPPPNDGVEHAGQVVYLLVNATIKAPASNGLTDGFGCGITDAGTEIDEVLPPPVLRPSRAKGIAQEVELLVGILTPSVVIRAIDDGRLVRMDP